MHFSASLPPPSKKNAVVFGQSGRAFLLVQVQDGWVWRGTIGRKVQTATRRPSSRSLPFWAPAASSRQKKGGEGGVGFSWGTADVPCTHLQVFRELHTLCPVWKKWDKHLPSETQGNILNYKSPTSLNKRFNAQVYGAKTQGMPFKLFCSRHA